jgi:TonB family protein
MSKKSATHMRRSLLVLALLSLPTANTWAQQAPQTPPLAQNAPPPVAPPTAPPAATPPPQPEPDGSYEMGSGVTSPKIIQAAPAVYPNEPPPSSSCYLSMTIGADGLPYNVRGLTPTCVAYQAAAIEAVQKSKFEAGLLGQKPVPVRVEVRVHFSPDRSPAIPQVMHNSGPQGTPPMVMHSVDPEYSKEARRKKITGIVIVSTLINEQGLPTDVRVEKSLGYGLDEEAVKAVGQYRFKPSQKDGRPVAVRVHIEVNFQTYQ